jgi:hypothetical protein
MAKRTEPSLEPLELALFDVIAMHLEKRGQQLVGDDAETAVALLGPAIRNLTAVVQELQD